ncbi:MULTISPECIES: histidine phosphatase family protein [unclassified Nocardioides]|uniref:histidine phosphatase family protein n=1 Tax=unclassified Nocardioides TaxID=2615069 RepID=UPI0009E9C8C2
MTELLVVRHGQSTWNVAGRIQGQTASPKLTDLGRRQAAGVAARLLGHGPRKLLTSDLVRAWQSAEIIGGALGLEPLSDPRLRERHYGIWQGRNADAARQASLSLADHQRLPGGESVSDLRQRWLAVAAELRGTPGPVVLVTHGNIIAELAGDSVPGNGSVTRISLV